MTKKEYLNNIYQAVSDEIHKDIEGETSDERFLRTRTYFFKTMYDVMSIATQINFFTELYEDDKNRMIKRILEYLNEEMK